MRGTAIAALLIAFAAIGCSDKSTGTLQPGDPNDPAFTQAQPVLEEAIAQSVQGLDLAMDFVFVPPSTSSVSDITRNVGPNVVAAADTFSYSYNEVTGWHVAWALSSDVGYSYSELDSVQFQDAVGDHMQDPDETTDFVHVISHVDASFSDSTGSGEYEHYFNATLSGLTGTQVTADGEFSVDFSATFVGDSATCDISASFSNNVDNVVFDVPASELAGVCPTSGSVRFTGAMSGSCTGSSGSGNVNQNWIVVVVFNDDGTMDVEAVSGGKVWNYSGDTPCGNYEGTDF
jgi:hypothetical protein